MRVEVAQGLDERGEPEEFTWDLFPLVPTSQTVHLGQEGLPKVGTIMRPGMILVGKIGKTRTFDPSHLPTKLELNACSEDELMKKYGHMWMNKSLYATQGSTGVVIRAYLENTSAGLNAVVELETDEVG